MKSNAALAASALLLALVGCGPDEPLPPSGVQGPIVLHQWRDDGHAPLVVVAHQIIQGDQGLKELQLEAVLVRLPFEQGTLFIAAPRATYSASTAMDTQAKANRVDNVRLMGDQRTRLKISGEIAGEPMIGTAEEAWMIDGVFNLRGVDLFGGGRRQTAERVHVVRDVLGFDGRVAQQRPPPGIVAVLGALPRPMRYPEFRRGDFAQ